MKKIKTAAGAVTAALAMVLGLALPAGAQQATNCQSQNASANICPNVNVDRSVRTTINLAECAGIITSSVNQTQANTAVNAQTNAGSANGVGAGGAGVGAGVGVGAGGQGTGGAGTGSGSNQQSNNGGATATGNQSASIVFSPDCSTHNVTRVVQAAASDSSDDDRSQVNAPKGGVHAGAGGAVTSVVSAIGLIGSVVTTGFGLVVRARQMF